MRAVSKSWFDYRWDNSRACDSRAIFAVLPEITGDEYPVAVFRWHTENPTKKRITAACCFHGRTCADGCAIRRDFRADE